MGSAFLFPFLKGTRIQDTTKRVRVNRQIRISPVRVIGADGSQLGILEVEAALAAAKSRGWIWSKSRQRLARPWSASWTTGSTSSRMAKQARQAKKKQHVIELKEVKYRPGIDDHDFDTKTRHARRFLEEKNKVKVTHDVPRAAGRAPRARRQAVLDRVAQALADVGKIESRAEVGREVHDDDSRAEIDVETYIE